MTVHLPKAWAAHWGAPLAPRLCPTTGICPGTGSSGESESAVYSLVPCMCCVWWEVGESQAASFFQDMGKEGPYPPRFQLKGVGHGRVGGAAALTEPRGQGQDGKTASPVCEHSPGPPEGLFPSYSLPRTPTRSNSVLNALALSYNFCTSWESQPLSASSALPRLGDSLPLTGWRSPICTRRGWTW